MDNKRTAFCRLGRARFSVAESPARTAEFQCDMFHIICAANIIYITKYFYTVKRRHKFPKKEVLFFYGGGHGTDYTAQCDV